MANSIINDIKTKVITEIVNDEAFFYAINSPTITNLQDADLLPNTHLFRFNQNPNTLNKTITFLTFQVHTQKQNRYRSEDIWIMPVLEIWIYSHHDCMQINNIPKITDNRNDYISRLLEDKFNGRTSLGTNNDPKKLNLLGSLDLVENSEGVFTEKYLYRKMLFVTKDLNRSMCD